MSQSKEPSWYESGDIEQSLKAAFGRSDVTTDDIVSVLGEHELNASRERIVTMVETARKQLAKESDGSSLPTPSLDEQREPQVRFLSPGDLNYLGQEDAATIIGAMLSRFEGDFRVPESVDDDTVDLLWIRSGTTVELVLKWGSEESRVGRGTLESVVNEHSESRSDGDMAELAVVSNASFTDDAREVAAEHDIYCCGSDHLSRWCQAAQLPATAVGKILNSESLGSDEVETVLEQLPPLPSSIPVHDPLQSVARTEWTKSTIERKSQQGCPGKDTDPSTQSSTSGPSAPSDPGKQGVLYADPGKDGDFDAFDRFTDGLTDGDSS